MEDFTYVLRMAYSTGRLDPLSILHYLGLEEKHSRKMTSLLRGKTCPEAEGPLSTVDFSGLVDFIPSIRQGYNSGLSIETLARQYKYPAVVIRKVLSGEYAKYIAGPLFPELRQRPNDPALLFEIEQYYSTEVDMYFNPAKYVDRPDPVWLQDDDDEEDNDDYSD